MVSVISNVRYNPSQASLRPGHTPQHARDRRQQDFSKIWTTLWLAHCLTDSDEAIHLLKKYSFSIKLY